jgi:hypothetical protein
MKQADLKDTLKKPPRVFMHSALQYLLTTCLLLHQCLQVWKLQKTNKRTLMTLNEQMKEVPKWIFLWLDAQPKYRSYLIIRHDEGPARVRLMELCCTYKFVTEWYFSYLISLVKLTEHNRIQLVWVPGHMGTDGPISRTRLLTSTHKTSVYPSNICKDCQESDQGWDKQEIQGVLAVHSQTKAG